MWVIGSPAQNLVVRFKTESSSSYQFTFVTCPFSFVFILSEIAGRKQFQETKIKLNAMDWKSDGTLFCLDGSEGKGVKIHDDVIKWKHFPRQWPFVRGIHRWSVNSRHKGQWRGALLFCLIGAWIHGWVNNGEAGDLRRHRAHYDVTVMKMLKWIAKAGPKYPSHYFSWVEYIARCRYHFCCLKISTNWPLKDLDSILKVQ